MLKNSGSDSKLSSLPKGTEITGEPERLSEQPDALFNAKAVSILSADSPFFDALWPAIFELADSKTKRVLELTNSYFRGMAKRARARELSAKIKAYFIRDREDAEYSRPPPNSVKLDPRSDSPLWYEWGADKAGFESLANFEEFCRLADVRPAEGVAWHSYVSYSDFPPVYSFLSSTGDINFVCKNDPRVNDDAYVHYFGCTGEREKALKLEAWFQQNCQWEEICHGGREFI